LRGKKRFRFLANSSFEPIVGADAAQNRSDGWQFSCTAALSVCL